MFDVVVVIGHSNEQGIKISSEMFATWEAFAAYLKPFKPRRLMMVACKAGRWPAANVLFKKLPRLRRIFASPVLTGRDQGALMVAMLPLLLAVKAPSDDAVLGLQALVMGSTGGQVRQWMRNRDKDNPDGLVLDGLSQLLEPVTRDVPNILAAILGGRKS